MYKDIINNPIKYKKYISWLLGKFKDFINKHKPLSIYIGNDNFLKRGDQELENYLQKSVKIMSNYIETGKITPNKISTVMYHLNLMSK